MDVTLKLKYFVNFDGLMGKAESLRIAEGASIADLVASLARKYPGFSASSNRPIVIIINGIISGPDAKISAGDEVSILTPQLGG